MINNHNDHNNDNDTEDTDDGNDINFKILITMLYKFTGEGQPGNRRNHEHLWPACFEPRSREQAAEEL